MDVYWHNNTNFKDAGYGWLQEEGTRSGVMVYRAEDIANWFIARANQREDFASSGQGV